MAVSVTSQAQAPPAAAPADPKPSLVKDSGPKIDTSPFPPQTSAKPVPRGDYLTLALGRLEPSKTNPRKRFEGPDFDELVLSIGEHGVIQPLLVRSGQWKPLGKSQESPDKYEIVAGERRFRAARKAGLLEVPVIVRELSDEEALELQIVENLQRSDVTELEEADGYVRLLDSMSKTGMGKTPRQKLVEQMAAKVGKSVRYVYGRMKLTELAPEVKAAIVDGKITPSHGDEIARLPLTHQKKALEHCFTWNKELCSVREFKAVLGRGFTAQLSAAPWKLDEVLPLPAKSKARLIACAGCPANVDGTCYDTACFAGKREAFVAIQIDKAYSVAVAEHDPKSPLNPSVVKLSTGWGSNAKGVSGRDVWVEAKKGSCKLYKIGVIVEGDGIGEMRRACLATGCKVHHPAASRRGSSVSSGKKSDPKEVPKQKLARELDDFQQRAVFREVLKRVVSFDKLADFVLEQEVEFNCYLSEEGAAAIAEFFGWKSPDAQSWNAIHKMFGDNASKLTAVQKAQLYVALRLGSNLGSHYGTGLDQDAKKFKVDVKAVREKAKKEFQAKEKLDRAVDGLEKKTVDAIVAAKKKSTAKKAAKKGGRK